LWEHRAFVSSPLSVVRSDSNYAMDARSLLTENHGESLLEERTQGHEKIHSGGGIGHAALGSQPTTRVGGRLGRGALAALSALPLFT
jgi:hypothetical protein